MGHEVNAVVVFEHQQQTGEVYTVHIPHSLPLPVPQLCTHRNPLSFACSARKYLSWSSAERPSVPIRSRVFLGFWVLVLVCGEEST